MCAVANCSLSRSSGETSATTRAAIPAHHSASRPTPAARGPPCSRARRHRSVYTTP
jgi:hypothetical protein